MRLTFTPEAGEFDHTISKTSVEHVKVTKIACAEADFLAYAFNTGLATDKDGAPNAYGKDRPGHPLQQGLKPIDHLQNAAAPYKNFPNGVYRWTGVVAATKAYALLHKLQIDDRFCATGFKMEKGKKSYPSLNLGAADAALGAYPVIQTTGATKGYYVSGTNRVKAGASEDQSIYANPLELPLTVRTGVWHRRRVYVGDFGWAVNPHFSVGTPFAFGDTNGSKHVGEVSVALSDAIGKPHRAFFLVFPNSGVGRDSLMGMNTGTMANGVRAQFAKLAKVENAMDLIEFLVANADLDKFEAARKMGLVSNVETTRRRGLASRLFVPLTQAGFPLPISDFARPTTMSRAS